jgi:hypothetical protein
MWPPAPEEEWKVVIDLLAGSVRAWRVGEDGRIPENNDETLWFFVTAPNFSLAVTAGMSMMYHLLASLGDK